MIKVVGEMNKRRGILEELKRSLTQKDSFFYKKEKIGVCCIEILFDELLEYYFIYDIANGTNHAKIFYSLYFEEEKHTYDEIAEKFYIENFTLRRYIKKYNATMEKCLIYRIDRKITMSSTDQILCYCDRKRCDMMSFKKQIMNEIEEYYADAKEKKNVACAQNRRNVGEDQ